LSFNGSKPDPYWFNPLTEMLLAVGAADPRYIWWSGVLGNSTVPQLTNMTVLGEQPEPTYPAETTENIIALGFAEFFRVWMLHYLWTIIQ
jgi:hypothetical protein